MKDSLGERALEKTKQKFLAALMRTLRKHIFNIIKNINLKNHN